MHLFYTPDITENLYALPEEESKHCVKVLRLEVGDEIFLIDGKGGFYRCEIIQAQPKRCEVRCIEKTEGYGKRDFTAVYWQLPAAKVLFYNGEANFRSSV